MGETSERGLRRYQGIGLGSVLAEFGAVLGALRRSLRADRARIVRLVLVGAVLTVLASAWDANVVAAVKGSYSGTAKHWAREISSKAQPYKLPGLLGLSAWLAGRCRRNRRLRLTALAVLMSMSVAGLSADVLKVATGRVRPENGEGWRGFSLEEEVQSFPSAHTSVAFATAVPVMEVYPAAGAVLMAGAAATGWARIYLLHHHLSDVVAGAYLGGIVGVIFGWAVRRADRGSLSSPGGSGPG